MAGASCRGSESPGRGPPATAHRPAPSTLPGVPLHGPADSAPEVQTGFFKNGAFIHQVPGFSAICLGTRFSKPGFEPSVGGRQNSKPGWEFACRPGIANKPGFEKGWMACRLYHTTNAVPNTFSKEFVVPESRLLATGSKPFLEL